jgi:multidrug efflux system membrane fusion protein
MGIKVRFLEEDSGREAGHPLVPASAVLRDGDAASVWVVRDGHVERRSITLGPADGERVAVLQGLQGGEAIVVDAPRRLRDGATVELKADGS